MANVHAAGCVRYFMVMVLCVGLFAHSVHAIAAEGGSSMYIPGGAGDALIALSPEPGLQLANALAWPNQSWVRNERDRPHYRRALDLK